MINHIFIILRSSNIWNLLVFLTFYGCITNLQSGQLRVGLIAQLVEHCTGVAEHGFESRWGLIFLQTLIPQLLNNCFSCVHNCDDQSSQRTVVQRVENRRAKQHNKLTITWCALADLWTARCVLLTPFSYSPSVAYLLVNCYLLLLYCIVTENQSKSY